QRQGWGMSRNRRNTGEDEGPLPAAEEDAAPVPADLSGWSPHPSERRGFYHRVRGFPPEGGAWRQRISSHLRGRSDRLPAARATTENLQGLVDDGLSYLRELARILAVLHGNPTLGNKQDPTDELVYILLARHTREGAYQQAFDLLRKRFPTWDHLL